MKTLFTLLLIVLAAVAALSSYTLFMTSNYYSSAFLTIVWYLSISFLIALIGSRRFFLAKKVQ